MISKIVFTGILISTSLALIAQKPVRKGVRPVQQVNSASAPKYNLSQMQGKWQERQRFSRESTSNIDFTDTLLIMVKGSNAETREGNTMNMNMKGQVRISSPNILEMAGDTYSIISLSGDRLTIDDGQFRRTLSRVKSFHFESLGKTEIKQEDFTVPIIVNVAELKGKWAVYRTKALPGYVNADLNLVKYITIRNDSLGKYAVGDISFHKKDMLETQPARISFEGNNMIIQAADVTWNLFLYKASGGELVFGKSGELLYYAKPL